MIARSAPAASKSSIVRRIAEKLGGSVGVESQIGAGSKFWFELPASAPPIAGAP